MKVHFQWILTASRFSQDMSLLDMQLPVAFGISLQSSWSPILQSDLITSANP